MLNSICLANHKIAQSSTRKCGNARYMMHVKPISCIWHHLLVLISWFFQLYANTKIRIWDSYSAQKGIEQLGEGINGFVR
jgi:hypothetical protein